MINQPLISVIVPIYKVEDYLCECVDSILGQTYTNLEIILVDDGSPDNCGKICDDYARQDSRIVVIHKENGGLSDARNSGLDICKGDYISFIDSDDFVHRRFIEVLYHNLIEHNAAISFCDFVRFKNKPESWPLEDVESKSELLDGQYMIDNLYSSTWIPRNIVVWNKLYSKEIFSDLRFPKGINHEDEYIFVDLYKDNPRVVHTSAILHFYRYNADSIMGNKFSENNVMSFCKIMNVRSQLPTDIFSSQLKSCTELNIQKYLCLAIINNSKTAKRIIQENSYIRKIILNQEIFWKTKIVFIFKYFRL